MKPEPPVATAKRCSGHQAESSSSISAKQKQKKNQKQQQHQQKYVLKWRLLTIYTLMKSDLLMSVFAKAFPQPLEAKSRPHALRIVPKPNAPIKVVRASEELLERSAKEGTEEDILLTNEQLIPKWKESTIRCEHLRSRKMRF